MFAYGQEYYTQQQQTSYLNSPDSQSSGSSFSDGSPIQGDLSLGTPLATPCFPGQGNGAGFQEYQRQMAQAQAQQSRLSPNARVQQGEMSMGTPQGTPCFPDPYAGYQALQRPVAQAQAQSPQFLAPTSPMSIDEINRITLMQAQATAHTNAYYAWTQHLFNQPSHAPYSNMYAAHPYALTPDLITDAFQIAQATAMAQQHGIGNQENQGNSKNRRRLPYNKRQLSVLNARFAKSNQIHIAERRELSKTIGLSPDQIKVWFQNRRYKCRENARKQQEKAEEKAEQEENKKVLKDLEDVLEGTALGDLDLGGFAY